MTIAQNYERTRGKLIIARHRMNLKIGERVSIKLVGGYLASDVRYAVEATDSEIDLDWGEIENYGTDIDVSDYILNHDGAFDYGEISDPVEIEVYKVSTKWDLIRKRHGGGKVLPINFDTKCTGMARKWYREYEIELRQAKRTEAKFGGAPSAFIASRMCECEWRLRTKEIG